MLAVGAAPASVGTPTGCPSAPIGSARVSPPRRLRGVTSFPCESRTTTACGPELLPFFALLPWLREERDTLPLMLAPGARDV
eukprot:scaffold4502_cov119-Isochrysis_galbana.AAC.15